MQQDKVTWTWISANVGVSSQHICILWCRFHAAKTSTILCRDRYI